MKNKNQEIERKFLVNKRKIKQVLIDNNDPVIVRQGFLSTHKDRVVRVRTYDTDGFITIKGNGMLSHKEFEYKIPFQDVIDMLNMCDSYILKKRFLITQGNHIWEVDVFLEDNKGLIIAEIELESEDENFEKPDWIGREVTGDKRYYNSNISKNPYKNWK